LGTVLCEKGEGDFWGCLDPPAGKGRGRRGKPKPGKKTAFWRFNPHKKSKGKSALVSKGGLGAQGEGTTTSANKRSNSQHTAVEIIKSKKGKRGVLEKACQREWVLGTMKEGKTPNQ